MFVAPHAVYIRSTLGCKAHRTMSPKTQATKRRTILLLSAHLIRRTSTQARLRVTSSPLASNKKHAALLPFKPASAVQRFFAPVATASSVCLPTFLHGEPPKPKTFYIRFNCDLSVHHHDQYKIIESNQFET